MIVIRLLMNEGRLTDQISVWQPYSGYHTLVTYFAIARPPLYTIDMSSNNRDDLCVCAACKTKFQKLLIIDPGKAIF